ncbi:MAG: ATP-binding cassette domain-containing protein [Terracidiphilus sp.]
MGAAVEFRDVTYEAAGRRLLDRVSLALEERTVTAILGRSGAGKTTLLRTVNRMVEPTAGEVKVRGRLAEESDAIALRRSMGYVIQETGLFPHFTVERNVGLVLEAEERPRAEREARCGELLEMVGLKSGEFRRRFPHQLSGGQRQRVGLARALAAKPDILLMDEPFGALDPLTRAEMQDMLLGLLEQLRVTVLLVTHDLDEALLLGDRIVLMTEGRVAADLTAEEFERSELVEVAAYRRAFHRGNSS